MTGFRDALPEDRDAVPDFWPHPERLDLRFAAAATGAGSLLVAVMSEAEPAAAGGRINRR